jgi:two-component system response regulator AtoC
VDTAIQAMKAGAYDYVAKPFKEDEIVLILEKALERGRLLDENRLLRRQIKDRFDISSFLGDSPAMGKVFDLIAKVAETRATVLITGESGTGKSLLARYIHVNSRRSKEPLVQVNCAALPESLLEAELFGYEKGAFTGADSNGKAGLLETAGKGTLFLDEIGEMPLSVQAKLLTFLDAGEFRRIGGSRVLKAECAVITATNQNLEMLVKSRRFRPDLSFRLTVFSLTIPPLRKRPEDIVKLAQAALDKFNRKYHTSRNLDPLAWDILKNYHYPGNVRELFNIIHQAVLLSDKKSIGSFLKSAFNNQPLLEEIQAQPVEESAPPSSVRARKTHDSHLLPFLDTAKSDLEKNVLLRAMAKSRNTRDIASYLGISQASVSRKLRKHGLVAPGTKKYSADDPQ